MSFLYFLAGLRTPALNQIMLGISHLGSAFFIVGLIIWFYLNVNKDEACGMLFSFTISCVLAQGIKIVFRTPRPWTLGNGDFAPVEEARASATGYSFPSVHTQSATAFSLSYIYYNKGKCGRIVVSVLLALVAFSRMYLGCHTPVDVLCGFTVSALVTVIVVNLLKKAGPGASGDGSFLFFLAAISVLLICLGTALLMNGTVNETNAKDVFSTAGLSLGMVVGIFVEQHFIHISTDGTLIQKLLRFALTAGVALGAGMGLKAIFGAGPLSTALRYGFMGVWMTGAAPFLLIRLKLSRISDSWHPV